MQGVEKGKMAPVCMFNSKWLTFCGPGAMMSRGFFLRLRLTKACTKFSPAKLSPTSQIFINFLEGAIEQL